MLAQNSINNYQNNYSPIDQIKGGFKKAARFSFEVYSSKLYKKFTIVVGILEKIKTLAEQFFSSLLEHPEIKYLKDYAFSILKKISKTLKKISTVFKFISIPKLSKKIKNDIKNKNKAVKKNDANAIFDAKLKTLSLIGKCLKVPKTVYSFFDLTLGEYSPKIFKNIAKPFKQVLFLFSPVALISKKRSLDSTKNFRDQLLRIKREAFIQQYRSTHKSTEGKIAEQNLSLMDLKNKIKTIKSHTHIDIINISKTIANRTFLNSLSQKVSENSDVIRNHFKISLKKDESNFFHLLRESQNTDKAASAIKCIKSRLSQKMTADKYAITQKVIGLSITFLEAVQLLSAPILPVTTAITGVFAVVSGINSYREFKHASQFKENMTKYAMN